jgi:hypothetical protein
VKRLLFAFIMLPLICIAAHSATLDELIADRAAIERVYHSHRIGATQPFETALPADALQRLVEKDLAREEALRSRYGIEISTNQIAAEVARINKTTKAPKTLAEIKAALGNDLVRFDRSFVKPILVERLLRLRFENDDALHAPVRRECEMARTNLLVAKSNGTTVAQMVADLKKTHANAVAETTWSLAPHPAEHHAASVGSVTRYFDELPPQLRQVLAAQLLAPGDFSAVIETSEQFLLFVAEEKNDQSLTTACLALPKQDCDSWLAAQSGTFGK